jgi:hypothetical protein
VFFALYKLKFKILLRRKSFFHVLKELKIEPRLTKISKYKIKWIENMYRMQNEKVREESIAYCEPG